MNTLETSIFSTGDVICLSLKFATKPIIKEVSYDTMFMALLKLLENRPIKFDEFGNLNIFKVLP